MARLALILILLLAVLALSSLVLTQVAQLADAKGRAVTKGNDMPSRLGKIAYVLLIVLLFSATGGVL